MSSSGYSSDDDKKGTRVFKDPEYPVVIVDQKYCSECPVTLTFEKTAQEEDKIKISDEEGQVLFRSQIKKDGRRVMLDDSDQPVINFITKQISLHARRQAFRGDSNDQRVFSIKKTRGLNSARYDVYMASNLSESTFNYRVYDSFKDGSSIIFAADETTKLAQLNIQVTNPKNVKAEEKFTVSLSPKVDKAFIAALLIIRDEIS